MIITSKSMHNFEVVESIPSGYEIWNIGDNMVDGYIPLAEVEGYKINPDTLKAIKLEDEEVAILRDCAHYGVNNLETARKALARKNPKGWITRKKKELAKKSINIFEKIS